MEPPSQLSADVLIEKLRGEFEQLCRDVTTAVNASDSATLATPHPHEGTRKHFPTIGDMVVFLMTSHEMDHLGQLAAWRRAMGLGPAKR